MSGLAVGLTINHLPSADHSVLSVAVVLAEQADQWGEKIFPGVDLVAALARISVRQTQYCMRKLEEMGYLIKVKEGGGRGKSTEWRVDLTWLKKQPDLTELVRAERARKKGAQRAPITETVQEATEVVDNSEKRCTEEEGKVQKGCTKGARACAPDPKNQPTLPLNRKKLSKDGLDGLVAAGMWKAKKDGKIKANAASYQDAMVARITLEGPNKADLKAFEEYENKGAEEICRQFQRFVGRSFQGKAGDFLITATGIKNNRTGEVRDDFSSKATLLERIKKGELVCSA